MSELINTGTGRKSFHRQLLTSVSVLALIGFVNVAVEAKAADEDSDRPTVWIELGGQLERVDAPEQQFVPPFILAMPRPGPETVSPLSVGHPPRSSVGGEGKISFEPLGTDWVFSAAIRYGRSSDSKHLRQQSYPTQAVPTRTPYSTQQPKYRNAIQFIDVKKQNSETHAVADFQAGKDVGLGMFRPGSSSVVSFGVRYAQFSSKSQVAFKSDPDAHPTYKYFSGQKKFWGGIYHSNAAAATATRSFRGLGPSISWDASAPVLGNPGEGMIALDWGANAAVLFGRQKAIVHHEITAQYHKGPYDIFGHSSQHPRTTLYRHDTNVPPRARTVTLPNVGGFAGLSYRFNNAKLSLGYRGDFFFGAMDGGIDAVHTENRAFYGPFASVSVGIGG